MENKKETVIQNEQQSQNYKNFIDTFKSPKIQKIIQNITLKSVFKE